MLESTAAPLAGQVALVTGAGQGLGRAMALAFAAAGASLVLAARRADDLEAVAEQVRARSGTVLAVPTDVRDAGQVTHLAERTLAEFGRVDLLVNNAGVGAGTERGPNRSLLAVEPAAWDAVFETNLRGVYLCLRAFLPGMLVRNFGTVVNVTSMLAQRPGPGLGPYGASKAALDYLTQVLAAEVAGHDVRVYGLHPGGGVATQFWGPSLPPDMRQPGTPQPSMICPAVLYLAVERPAALHGGILNAREFNARRAG